MSWLMLLAVHPMMHPTEARAEQPAKNQRLPKMSLSRPMRVKPTELQRVLCGCVSDKCAVRRDGYWQRGFDRTALHRGTAYQARATQSELGEGPASITQSNMSPPPILNEPTDFRILFFVSELENQASLPLDKTYNNRKRSDGHDETRKSTTCCEGNSSVRADEVDFLVRVLSRHFDDIDIGARVVELLEMLGATMRI